MEKVFDRAYKYISNNQIRWYLDKNKYYLGTAEFNAIKEYFLYTKDVWRKVFHEMEENKTNSVNYKSKNTVTKELFEIHHHVKKIYSVL